MIILPGAKFVAGTPEQIAARLDIDEPVLRVLMDFGAPVHEIKDGLYFTHLDRLNDFVANELADFAERAQL
jgi:hypothetical protein